MGVVSLLPIAALLPVPLLIKRLFDTTLPSGDRGELVAISLALFALQLLGALATNVGLRLVIGHAKQGIMKLRDDVAEKLYSVSVGYLGRHQHESLYGYLLHESQRVESMSSALFGACIPGALLVIGIMTVLVSINPVLCLLTFTFVPFMVASNRSIGTRVRVATADHGVAVDAFGRNTHRLLRLMLLTRSRDAQPFELAGQHEHHDVVRRRALRLDWMRNLYAGVHRGFVAASLALVLVVGGNAVISGTISLGELFSFYAGVALLRHPVELMISALPLVIGGRHSLARVIAFLEEDDHNPYQGRLAIDFSGHVEVRHVSFAYDERPVLNDVSLSLQPGVVTALVGPNGAGKSTLVNLLLGFYRPGKGSLFADGHAYDEVDLRAVRGYIGVVMQEPVLVDGTIGENLAYGSPGLPPSALEHAARLATADAFIADLPDGYDTVIGDGGTSLSGGQRQRLAIARALMHSPRVLILDEPTNHLDERSLGEVLANLWALPHAPAVLLISHDNRALAGADVLVHVRKGRVVGHEDRRAVHR